MTAADVALILTPVILCSAFVRLWGLFRDLVWSS